MRRATIAIATTAMLASAVARADCEALSRHGVYDLSVNTSETERALAFRTWFCQQQFSSEQEASEVGLEIGYGGFQLGFDQNQESWSEFYSSYCRDESFNSRFRQQTYSFVKKINPTVVQALNSCLTQRGLHAWIEQGRDVRSFRFQTVYVPAATGDPLPVVEVFYVDGGSCQGALRVGARIGPDGTEMLCRREGDGAVEIGFDATSFVNKNTPLALGPVVKPTPPPVQRRIYIRAVDYTDGRDIAPAAGQVAIYGDGVILNAPPFNARPNMAEYRFEATAGGHYLLSVEYAAAESRPVQIIINGNTVRGAGLSAATGCWTPDCQRWRSEGEVTLRAGSNTMRIQRDNVFPHIRAFAFEPSG